MKIILCRRVIALFCFIILIHGVSANTSVFKFISNVDGLSNNSVNCIFEDSRQTMWIGTWDGLNAYNGRDIKVFRYSRANTNSLSNNVIRQILESGDCLWVSTDNGINRLNQRDGSIKRYYPHISAHDIPRTENTFTVAVDRRGVVYCWVKNKGLFKFAKDKFVPIHTNFNRKVKNFAINGSCFIFLYYDGSLKCRQLSRSGSCIRESELRNMASGIFKIFNGQDRLVAISGDNHVTVFGGGNNVIKKLSLPGKINISQIICASNRLYFGVIGGGCMMYDMHNSVLSEIHVGGASSSVLSLCYGSQGILWIGTDGHGLGQMYNYNPVFKAAVPSTFPVRCFCGYGDGEVLVGTKGAGLQKLNTSTGVLASFKNENTGLSSNSVYTLRNNGKGDVFIGTDGYGIDVLDIKTGKLQGLVIPSKYPRFRSVYNILLSHNGSVMWVATSGYGLIRIDISKTNGRYIATGMKRFSSSNRSNHLNNDIIYAIVPDADQRYIWFGTRGGGISRLDLTNNSVSRLGNLYAGVSTSNDDILCMCRDGNNIWIGTSYGLNLMMRVPSGYKVGKNGTRNLCYKTIHGIVKDLMGNTWVSTNDGLYKIGRYGKVENYTIKDGLQNNEFSDGSCYSDKSGTLFFGGVSGLNYFNPRTVHPRKFKPVLDLCSVRINNKDTDKLSLFRDNVLTLQYEERSISMRFIAKDYINTTGCEYAYRLDGAGQWVEMSTVPEIVLQLSQGRHVLEVKCTNSDKIWNDKILRLDIKVCAPWWFGTWAFLTYFLFLVSAAMVIGKIVRNKIRTRRLLFMSEMNKMQDKKIYEAKFAFFTNVAHELFTPLTLIYAPAQYLSDIDGLDEDIHKYAIIIKDNAAKMQKLVQNIIEFRKDKWSREPLCPEKIVVEDFMRSITQGYEGIGTKEKMNLIVNLHDTGMIKSDRSVLGEIIFEFLTYAFCHTAYKDAITFDCEQEDGDYSALNFLIRYKDENISSQRLKGSFNIYSIFDGSRADDKHFNNSLSRNLIKKMVEYLDGTIEANEDYDKNVEVRVRIPSLDLSRTGMIMIYHNPEPEQTKISDERGKLHSETSVLIVSDEPDITNLLGNILYDYTLTCFGDTGAALNYISRNHPDMIITDMHLGEAAFKLVCTLKQNVQTSYLPIIGISGKSSVEEQIDAYNDGVDIYIKKPFHPRQILSSIENLITRQSLLKDYFNSSMASMTIKDGRVLHDEDRILIDKINDYINEHVSDENLSPELIESYLGQSKASFYRKFRELTDMTPSEYIKSIRLKYAAKLLRTTKMTVSEIIFKSGFSNKSYFYREFKDSFHCSPNDYRRT